LSIAMVFGVLFIFLGIVVVGGSLINLLIRAFNATRYPKVYFYYLLGFFGFVLLALGIIFLLIGIFELIGIF
jgi:hypothetical protein